MFGKYIFFKNFELKKKKTFQIQDVKKLVFQKSQIFTSMSKKYKDNFKTNKILKKINKRNIRIFGIGGSILGAKSIYNFLNYKVKRKIFFIDTLKKDKIFKDKSYLNIIISKSGNTLETIANISNYLNTKDENIFLTENKHSYLLKLANKLKSEVVHHNNFIGGRYSVLSEVGMLPAELMGLNSKKFRQLDNLIKNKYFLNSLVNNVNSILFYIKKKKFNSIILNYDKNAADLFKWYQQLISESLGKKGKGILPVISGMPEDNHSLMQLYLDGPKNNFFTLFFSKDENNLKPLKKNLFDEFKYLIDHDIDKIKLFQKIATEKTFTKKNIPFRSFEIIKKDEKILGELFSFFIFETILLGRALHVNPFDQPSVEIIKEETFKIFSMKKTKIKS